MSVSPPSLGIGLRADALLALSRARDICRVVNVDTVSQALPLLQTERVQAVFVDASQPGLAPADIDALRHAAPDAPKIILGQEDDAPLISLVGDDSVAYVRVDADAERFLFALRRGVLVSPGRPGNSGRLRPSRWPLLGRMCPQCDPPAGN